MNESAFYKYRFVNACALLLVSTQKKNIYTKQQQQQ